MNGVHEHICTLFMLGEGEREKSSWHSFPWCWRLSWRSLKGGTVLHAVTLPSGIFALLEGGPHWIGGYLRPHRVVHTWGTSVFPCSSVQLSTSLLASCSSIPHSFENVFQSAAVFKALAATGLLSGTCWVGGMKENLLCSFLSLSRCPIATFNPGDFLMFSQNCQLGNWVYFWRTLWDWGVEML